MTDEEYKAQYDAAAAELDAAAQATTARGPDGKFTKAEPEKVEPENKPEPEAPKDEPKEPVKDEKEPVKEVDEVAALRERLAKAEKAVKDTQSWGTKAAQELAKLKREQEQRERDANKPAILDANPGLAEAIEFVARDPKPAREQEDAQERFYAVVEKAHPGIFKTDVDAPELFKAVVARLEALDVSDRQDPLVVIREITEEKLAFTERQVGKRFAAESAKLAQKSAMSVPGAGGGSGVMTPVDAQLAEVQRIQKMSDSDFAKEVRRVKGL